MRVLFVCTGNTCRSPMAEAIFRERAAHRLSASPDKLFEYDLDVLSAGVAAGGNSPASWQAVEVMKLQGIDLGQHLSQQVTDEMLDGSDLIFTLTPGHLDVLRHARPDLHDRMRTLRPDGVEAGFHTITPVLVPVPPPRDTRAVLRVASLRASVTSSSSALSEAPLPT